MMFAKHHYHHVIIIHTNKTIPSFHQKFKSKKASIAPYGKLRTKTPKDELAISQTQVK